MATSCSNTSEDAPAGQQPTMLRDGHSGLQKSQRTASTSRALSSIPTSEACAGPEAMTVVDVDGNEEER